MRILLAALLLLAPVSAWAHAHLQASEPPVGGTVHTPPAEVAITFSEAVEPGFSSIAVTTPSGSPVDTHGLHTAPGNAKQLVIGLGAVAPGTYRVEWHATSVDTHKTEGTFTFTVAP